MTALFIKTVNMSISASWLVFVVFLLRLILRKAPKWVNVLLWGIVAIRLLCPFSIESTVSLIPNSVGNGEMVSEWMDDYIGETRVIYDTSIHYEAAVAAGREPIYAGDGGYYVVTAQDQLGEPSTIENTVIPVLTYVWTAGISVLVLYAIISYWTLQRKVDTAVLLRYNIFQSEYVTTPFVLGICKPKIYLPYTMSPKDIIYVVSHEKAHIRRKDHWWKPLGFLLVTIHWFNPLLWPAYKVFCRDIELACDELVIQNLNSEHRADYAQALLSCSKRAHMVTACPIAFGEVGVKTRIRSVMNYRKPGFWMILTAAILCLVVCVCFLTDPKKEPPIPEQSAETGSTESVPETIESITGGQDNFLEQMVPGTTYVSDLAYFMEVAMPNRSFRNMSPEKQKEITKEYGSLLENHTLLARESIDGSFFYMVGHFNGAPEENPFRNLYQTTYDVQEVSQLVLYPEEELETVKTSLAAGRISEGTYLIKNSFIHYGRSESYVLIHPMDAGWDLTEIYNRYLSSNGREYMLDAISRGIAIATPEGPYLEVCLISETWGEIYEKIPLTEEQAAQILAEDRVKLEDGYGFAATLYPGPNSSLNLEDGAVWFTDFRGVSPTVLALASEKCGYTFATPRDIQGEIVEARLECVWLEEPIRYANDLQELQHILTNAEFGYIGKCGYGANLTIQMADGSSMTLFKGTDGCDSLAFGSYGGYFLGDAENEQFWNIFGLDAISKEPLKE